MMRSRKRAARNAGRRRTGRALAATTAALAVVVSLLVPVPPEFAAWAADGSAIGGTVWRDADRDGDLDGADEAAATDASVQLVDQATGQVVATTAPAADGRYRFADVPDGTYVVRVVAPNGMIFPADPAADPGTRNAFRREGQPATGQPETGVSDPVVISGATGVELDAGMYPIPNLTLEKGVLSDACEGYAQDGTPPWDAQDGPGLDAGSSNCVVRTGDEVRQQYTLGVNPLPSGATVPNVIIEFDVATPDGATLELTGPGTDGLPDGCLGSDVGADPPSRVEPRAGGGFTIVCNIGTRTAQNAILDVTYRFTGATPVPAHAEITARAYAAQGHAAPSAAVSGPTIAVTALPQWDLSKKLLTAPTATTWDGVPGFFVDYDIQLADTSGGVGGAQLEWPVHFTDRMPMFPGALLLTCRRKTEVTNSNWDIACPDLSTAGHHVPQGADGWAMTMAPRSGTAALEQGSGVAAVRVFVPRDEAYRALAPGWQPGDRLPEGTLDWENQLIGTDGWSMTGGQPNYGDGLEPGWDGEAASGNNVVEHSMPLTTPGVNATKWRDQGPSFTTRVVNGVSVPGYDVRYRYYITISDPNLLARWVDAPVSIRDVLSYRRAGDSTWRQDAVLVGCTSSIAPGTTYQRGSVVCPAAGVMPDGGWDVTYNVNSNGLNQQIGSWAMTYFIPMAQVPPGTCTATTDRFTVRNELQGTERWTVNGAPINASGAQPGYEPGWGPDEIGAGVASGDNLALENLTGSRPAPDCGSWRGLKQYYVVAGGEPNFSFINPGDAIGSRVQVSASTDAVTATDIVLCDVFDVSTMRIYGDPTAAPARANFDPHLTTDLDARAYVIEYAIGSNAVDTQAGANQRGVDSTQNAADVAGCRDKTEGWTTDPAAAFGADWRDRVNMVRARPAVPGTTAVGPFTHRLEIPLEVRHTYNGGPNAGEIIPNGIQLHNGGGWTDRTGTSWATGSERRPVNIRTDGWKNFIQANGAAWNGGWTYAGQLVRSDVQVRSLDLGNAPVDNPGPVMVDPTVCDAFDVSVFRLESAQLLSVVGIDPADYVVEYAIGSNAVDTQLGGTNGVDRSSLVADVTGCAGAAGPWQADPAAFGADWRDRVNMVRVRPRVDGHIEYGNFQLGVRLLLHPRGVYNGGPNAGEVIPQNTKLSNTGGWSTGDGSGWNVAEREMNFNAMSLRVGKTAERTQYLPGETAVWRFTLDLLNGEAGVGAVMNGVRLVDTIPPGMTYDAACTAERLPAGVRASYDPVTRQVVFDVGDVVVTQSPTQAVFAAADPLELCTTVSQLAQPGDTFVNHVEASAQNSANAPTGEATIRSTGTGQLGVDKQVDKPYVASGEPYTWSIEWANTSASIAFLPVDVIDVLSWVGDGEDGALSQRIQYGSDYTGTVRLTDWLSAPEYVRGATGGVPGTWYYATADPATIDHNPQPSKYGGPVANDAPEAPGGLWRTREELEAAGLGFGDATAVRFVSAEMLPKQSRVQARITAVSTTDDVGMLYVNRAEIFSETFRLQPLLSSEPYVQIPGFSVGDLVWLDRIPDGRYDPNKDRPLAGVTVHLLDADGRVVASRVTNAQGRWAVHDLPPGEYRARIPASMFQAGGPLAPYVVSTVGSNPANDQNENLSNQNTVTGDPAVVGLTSSPITVAYRYSSGAAPRLIGGDGPLGDDVARLAPGLVTPDFTNFTIDLMVNEDPAIDIEKATNAADPRAPTPSEDADVATGPYIAPGSTVTWTYLVTNTGLSDLFDVTVTDDRVDAADIDCDGTGSNVIAGPLPSLGTVLCVATGVAEAGQYANVGSVTALGPSATDGAGNPLPRETVADEDASHYFGAAASVDLEKYVEGLDADQPESAPQLPVGDEIAWSFVVTNTGNVDLRDLEVTDDVLDASRIDCDGTGGNVIAGPLEPGGTFTCTAHGVVAATNHVNTGRVTAVPPFDPTTVPPEVAAPVDDTDQSHYVGLDVDLEKSTNTFDADSPAGPLIAPGDPVLWEYVVTNTGAGDLFDIEVTDDRVADSEISCGEAGAGNVVAGPLAPGESVTCRATGVAGDGTDDRGRYANLGEVTAVGPVVLDDDGEELPRSRVDDADPSHYWTAAPEVDIEKLTNGRDVAEAPGPFVAAGDRVTWTYVVTNTGPLDLFDLVVTDDRVASAEIDCDGTGGNQVAGPLAPGEHFECTATGVARPGQYVNRGEVRARGPETVGIDGLPVPPAEVEDDDPSFYYGSQPAVDIEKATNGEDADEPTGPRVAVGGEVEWTYRVENTGNVELFDLAVVDDRVDADAIDCGGTGGNAIAGPLAPGDSFTCTARGAATAGQYANLGTVTAHAPETVDADGEQVAPATVRDEDWSHYFGAAPAVDIEKHTDGRDADEPTGPFVAPGGGVRWTYLVTNTGNVDLVDVVVTDDRVDASAIDCGEGSNIVAGPLEPGATFACEAVGVAEPGQYANLGAVTATGPETTDVGGEPVPGAEVGDDDWSHYLGVVPDVDIEKSTDGHDADEAPGPTAAVGDTVTWTYLVTNTGNAPLTDVTVTDDRVDAASIDCGAGSNVVAGPLEPGSTIECVAQGVATAGQYANLGTVVATPPATTDENGEPVPPGPPVTDEDWSHYVGAVASAAPPPPTVGDLAGTGAQLAPLGLGGAALFLGGLLFVLGRRRRSSRPGR